MKRIIDIPDALYEGILNNKVQNGSVASRVALNLIQSSVPYEEDKTEQEQKWTPVSEGMPDYGFWDYWLTVKYFHDHEHRYSHCCVIKGQWRDERTHFNEDKWEWEHAGKWVDENGDSIEGSDEICKVIAWMPCVIPEAYDEHGLNDGGDEEVEKEKKVNKYSPTCGQCQLSRWSNYESCLVCANKESEWYLACVREYKEACDKFERW